MARQKISIAYSPDTDDAFMVHALRTGALDPGPYEFSFVSADIQLLNEAALQKTYDVTAISMAAYPDLQDDYYLMPIGASIGDRFGPALIVKKSSPINAPKDLAGKRIAVPGLRTSAYFAARALIGPFEPVPMLFSNISGAVDSGEVDAGILIHELQLRCEEAGFRKLGDIGKLWAEAFQLPLPLGANAIRRDLGPKTIQEVTALMRQSIEIGLEKREQTLKDALRQSGTTLDYEGGNQYISMYVNQNSLRLSPEVKVALSKLLSFGGEAGVTNVYRPEQAFYET